MIQGIVTGVGFLGRGHYRPKRERPSRARAHHGGLRVGDRVRGRGLRDAQWQIVIIGVALVLILLVFGGPFEKAIDRRWPGRPSGPSDQPPDRRRAPGPEM